MATSETAAPHLPLASRVLDALAAHIAVLDASGRIVAVNAAWRRFADVIGGEEVDAYVGESYLEMCDRNIGAGVFGAGTISAAIRGLLAGGAKDFAVEYSCHAADERRWFLARGTLLAIEGEPHVVISHEDVTPTRRIEAALRESEAKWRTLFEILPVGVSVIDAANRIVEHNVALTRILRLDAGNLASGSYRERRYIGGDGAELSPDQLPSARAVRDQVATRDEIAVVCEDGTRIWTTVDAAPLPPAMTGVAVVVVHDVTQRVAAREELQRAKAALEQANRELQIALARSQELARTDFLTGLPNRRHFYEIADHELVVAERYSKPLSVVLFDADTFKSVNDRFGHAVGDEVLRQISAAARSSLRAADVVARHGGEELAVLLPHTTGAAALDVAEQLRAAIAAVVVPDERGPVRITVSAGVAELRPGEGLDGVISRADQALYAAKAAGRDRAVLAG
jgi:diguanylate cyclase (GGDEF)-like protein/PAS domain S-box-containing protein